MTPREAWTGEKPSLAHLRTFGALVIARKPVSDLPRLTVIPLTVFFSGMDPRKIMFGTLIRRRIVKS
jgi:hypothetical protein